MTISANYRVVRHDRYSLPEDVTVVCLQMIEQAKPGEPRAKQRAHFSDTKIRIKNPEAAAQLQVGRTFKMLLIPID